MINNDKLIKSYIVVNDLGYSEMNVSTVSNSDKSENDCK